MRWVDAAPPPRGVLRRRRPGGLGSRACATSGRRGSLRLLRLLGSLAAYPRHGIGCLSLGRAIRLLRRPPLGSESQLVFHIGRLAPRCGSVPLHGFQRPLGHNPVHSARRRRARVPGARVESAQLASPPPGKEGGAKAWSGCIYAPPSMHPADTRGSFVRGQLRLFLLLLLLRGARRAIKSQGSKGGSPFRLLASCGGARGAAAAARGGACGDAGRPAWRAAAVRGGKALPTAASPPQPAAQHHELYHQRASPPPHF